MMRGYNHRLENLKGEIEMIMPPIDWNEVWHQIQDEQKEKDRDPEFWNKRAPSFSKHVSGSDYIRQFIDIMKPDAGWSVLDIGCAAGTLAVPLSPLVKSITALDPSTVMLSMLEERCAQEKLKNIRIVRGKWEDDWDDLKIGIHDVAIASRSLIIDDLQEAILKLESHASKRVYISTVVDDGPYNRKIIEAAGRKFKDRADYIVVYNLLRQMGRYADISFTVNRDEKSFTDLDDALKSLRWMIQDMTQEEEMRLREYLSGSLVRNCSGWMLPQQRIIRWAVMWWDL